MVNQLYLNILISFIIAISISYYYYKKINYKSLLNFIVIFLISFIILYYLGPKDMVESFHTQEECESKIQELSETEESSQLNNGEEMINNGEEMLNNGEEMLNNEEMDEENNNFSEEELNVEEDKQQEELESQEEYIRKVVEEVEVEEEDNNDMKKKLLAAKLLKSNNQQKAISGNNNQYSQGIGVGISPVNIYINGTEVDVDKFGNKMSKNRRKRHDKSKEKCDGMPNKNGSRIYNNCDWIYDKNDWCDGTYNYNKNSSGSNNNLLPSGQVEVNKIPQTLNNLMNTKKNEKKTDPCPLDVNKPWSIYKTGDDKEKNKIIPEGFNL